MRAYRLTRSKYPAFSGRGSLLANGRWHRAGVPAVYCAESRALAVLEALVHTRKDQIPSDYVFFELDIDDSAVRTLSTSEMPTDWRASEPEGARTLGTEWINSRSSIGLVVPSVVIPEERNLLLNAGHPDFVLRVKILGTQLFVWDPRLFH
ncbi:MAG: RES domain-containing protein [Acidobacteriaceae bacterium]|nr:RES domain-containing protein [Acidobacteriaceae bacterium]MBV9294055.1 RES domain-containing protein [Acidobacteriaceae bacterium]MBV9766542.1 RES domain-containing protein [Acidobacteriaceae bacterium]